MLLNESLALIDDIETCYERGWTDGLPVVPPYVPAVERMLEGLSLGWDEVLVTLARQNIDVRGCEIAAAAVLAGCEPSYGPILRAVADAILDPAFNLNGVAVTTGGAAILILASGSCAARFGLAHAANALGAAARPNATIGRFASLVMRFCAASAGSREEFGTLGHPGRLAFCVAEHPTTAWPPYHTQRGLPADALAITVHSAEGPNSVNNHYAETGSQLLETIADCLAHAGTTNFYYRYAGYVVVLAPEHMQLIASAFTREQAHEFLLARAVRPTDELLRLGRIPREPEPGRAVRPGTPRSPIADPAHLTFIEAGGQAGKFSAVIPLWVGNHSITRLVTSTPQGATRAARASSDVDCADSSCERLVSPIPRVSPRPLAVTRRPRRRRVTFVDTGKPNSARILQLAARELGERGVELGEPLRKARASRLAGEEILARAARDEGLVLVAVND